MQSIFLPPRRGLKYRVLLAVLLMAMPLAAQTALRMPSAVAFDPQGNLYIAEREGHRVLRVDAAGEVTSVAGSGMQGFAGDGGPATTAELDSPSGVAVDAVGNLYIADTHNHRVRRVDGATGVIATVAGSGVAGFAGDDGAVASARLDVPSGVAVDAAGNLYIADTGNQRVRLVNAATGVISTIAGNGTQGFGGDGGPASSAELNQPQGVAVSASGDVYIADAGNRRVRVMRGATGLMATVGMALALPRGLAVDAAGNVYIADAASQQVRRVAPDGMVTMFAGSGVQGFAGDGGSAAAAELDTPAGVAVSPAGLVTFADAGNGRARQVGADGRIYTVAGPGAVAASGTLTVTAPALVYGSGMLTATLAGGSSGTGSVRFMEGSVTLGTSAMTNGMATLSAAGLSAGAHEVYAVYSGDASHAAAQSAVSLVTVGKAASAVTITLSSGSAAVGTAVQATVHVSSSTSGVPTGSVSLLDGSTVLAVLQLSAGGATFTASALSVGSHALSAVYAGDGNFIGSTSVVGTVAVSEGSPADFTLVASGTGSQSVGAGGSASFSFQVQMQGGLASPVTLAASGLPSGATASFNPSYVPPGGAVTTFTMTVQTAKQSSGMQWREELVVAGFLVLFPLAGVRRRWAAVLLCVGLLMVTGCGDRIYPGSGSAAAASHTTTITVTGTATDASGAVLQHSATVLLAVQ
ncbi:MAG TPA: Ig-like domain repeat protein [Granulicella sp.]